LKYLSFILPLTCWYKVITVWIQFCQFKTSAYHERSWSMCAVTWSKASRWM